MSAHIHALKTLHSLGVDNEEIGGKGNDLRDLVGLAGRHGGSQVDGSIETVLLDSEGIVKLGINRVNLVVVLVVEHLDLVVVVVDLSGGISRNDLGLVDLAVELRVQKQSIITDRVSLLDQLLEVLVDGLAFLHQLLVLLIKGLQVLLRRVGILSKRVLRMPESVKTTIA